jgi:broad specificity phosphatase PhoE
VTPSNLGGRFNDHVDEPIDPGAAASLPALSLGGETYERIYVSPLRRCVQTAEHLGLTGWTPEARITERGLGVFQGLTPAQCRARHAAAFAAFSRLEAEPAIPEGESRGAHLARVLDWLEEASRANAGKVLAVTHGGVIDFLYRLSGAHPLHGGERIFAGENFTRSVFEIDWPEVRLLAFSQPLDPR